MRGSSWALLKGNIKSGIVSGADCIAVQDSTSITPAVWFASCIRVAKQASIFVSGIFALRNDLNGDRAGSECEAGIN